jgi:hypothetical protein
MAGFLCLLVTLPWVLSTDLLGVGASEAGAMSPQLS